MLDVNWGTLIWTTIAFLAVLWILAKFAWKPILSAIHDRERSIEQSLKAAEKARKEMAELVADNEELLKQARLERDAMLKDARSTREQLIGEAKEKATEEYTRIVNSAKETIHNEKMAALVDIKNQVATLSLELAVKLIRHQLGSEEEQKKLIEKYLEDANNKLN